MEWVFGVLFRPGKTFARATRELRFGYWWILLSVLTLEVVSAIFSPPLAGGPSLPRSAIFLDVIFILLMLFDLQSILLLVSAKAFGWRISWPEATKWIGLGWALFFVQDVVTFYPGLLGKDAWILWSYLPCFAWYIVSLTAGVKRVSGLPLRKSFLLVLLASVPWQVGLVWLNWPALKPGG